VNEHPTAGVEPTRTYERGQFPAEGEHPTRQLPPMPYPGDPMQSGGDPQTRAFSGFRTESRRPMANPHPGPPPGQQAPPTQAAHQAPPTQSAHQAPPTQAAPPAPPTQSAPSAGPHWEPTPHAGAPQVDPAGFGGYHGGLADAPARPREPQYRPERFPHSPYPELSTGMLLRPVKAPPSQGWRRLLYVMSGQLINVGEGPRAARYNNLVAQVNQPLRGCYRIALLSLKGGVGKTTITASLGSTFASLRGNRVVAVDASPDRGTLSQKVPLETVASVRQLLHDAKAIDRYSDIRRFTSQGPSGLEVLASDSDPAVSEPFSAEDYARALDLLERFYGVVITDCGTGLLHSAMSSVLARADVLLVISSGSIDGARSASATLDWLDAHGHEDLVRNAIVVVNAVRPRTGKLDMGKVVEHFSRRCRAVRLVPYDAHLEEGGEISLERLRRPTREALIELAAVVADGFPNDLRQQH
jgi:MinD-like ATPase involved in chromosome partitioning or flagellar assembly